MADWPVLEGQKEDTYGEVSSSSTGSSVTTGASQTYGSWVEIIPSVPFEVSNFILKVGEADGNDRGYNVDVGIGAAGSEKVLLSVAAYFGRIPQKVVAFPFPLTLKTGSRISVRGAGRATTTYAGGASTFKATIELNSSGFLPSRSLQTIGQIGILTIDPGSIANTKGAWINFGAAGFPYRAFILIIDSYVFGDVLRPGGSWLFDLGFGGSIAPNAVVVGDIYLARDATSDIITPEVLSIVWQEINPATYLYARAQSTISSSNTARSIRLQLLGLV